MVSCIRRPSASNSTSTGTNKTSTWSCCYIQQAPEGSTPTASPVDLQVSQVTDGHTCDENPLPGSLGELGAAVEMPEARERRREKGALRLTQVLDLEAAALVRWESPLASDFDPAISSSQFYC